MRKDIAEVVKKFLSDPRAIDDTQEDVKSIRLKQLRQSPASNGRDYLIAHYLGVKLSRSESIVAYCCEHSGYYRDGLRDCGCSFCPFYEWMPYGAKKYVRPDRRDK